MNKLLIAAVVAGLSSVAIAPSAFAQAQQAPQAPPAQPSPVPDQAPSPAVAFAAADTDKSGGISFKEATAIHPSLTQEQFDAVDKDKNGSLSEEEFAQLDAAPRVGQEAN
jgi:hypothetical protein